jgi:hypothetical protein
MGAGPKSGNRWRLAALHRLGARPILVGLYDRVPGLTRPTGSGARSGSWRWQASAGSALALLSWPWAGAVSALSALCGAAAVAAGFALYGGWVGGPRIESAGRALARLVSGTVLKWLAIAALLGAAMAAGWSDARFVLAGALVAIFAHLAFLARWLR